jgi:hypothetical protein
MKFGLLIDKCSQESFKIIDGKAYTFDGQPYSTSNSIDNHTHMSIFQYPFLFNNEGYFINLKKSGLPDIDFDIIFLVRERFYDEFPISDFRKKYPKAKIYGVLKEQYIDDEKLRCKALSECDEVILPFEHKYLHHYYTKSTGKSTIWIPQPYDIDFINNLYYKTERKYDIFSYVSPTLPHLRRANTEDFSSYISNKYNLTVKRVSTNNWKDFLNEISECRFIFNLDPIQSAGQTGIQSAILGLCAIGGNSDSYQHLYPLTNGLNYDNLENKIIHYLNNFNEYVNYIQQAYNSVNKIYGMEAVKSKILSIYDK